jgi:hypothetical protein
MAEKQIFFVCGAPKSGTTWLQRVLDAHPQLQCSGEGHFIERFTIPLAGVMRDYAAHMDLVAGRVYEGKPYYPQIGQADLDRIARGFIVDRLMARRPGPEVRWIGDKTPRYTNYLPALLRIFPQARFINIVRDPRDVAMARMHQARRAGVGDVVADDSPERIEFIRKGALDWANCVAPIASFTTANPGILHSLKYEDMIADPAGEARKLFRFLGVKDQDGIVREIVQATSFEAMTGRKPGEEHPTSFLRKGVAGDWVGRLELAAVQAIEQACGEQMRQHGYL